jgi:Na+-driven multidrug efflux pump
VLAGYTIAIRVIIFGILPSYGVSNAAGGRLVGQSTSGAGQPDRAERGGVDGGALQHGAARRRSGCIFDGGRAPSIVATVRTRTIALAQPFADGASLRIVSLGFVFYGCGMVSDAVGSTARATRGTTPTFINVVHLLESWRFRLAWIAGPMATRARRQWSCPASLADSPISVAER